MSSVSAYCPECIQTVYDKGVEVVDSLQKVAERTVVTCLPDAVHTLFLSVLRTIPETVLCAVAVLGAPRVAAVLWAIKTVSILIPMLETVFSCEFDIKSAYDRTEKNFLEFLHRLRPAILLFEVVAVSIYCLAGVVLTSSYFLKALMGGAVIQLVNTSLKRDPIPDPRVTLDPGARVI